MTPETFATHLLPRAEQFEAWHDWYGTVFDTTVRDTAGKGFPARNVMWRLGGVMICRVAAPGLHTLRSRALIRRNPVDHWVITVTNRGATRLTTCGISFEPSPGTPFIVSLADEMESERSTFERVQLYLPRDSFRGIGVLLDDAKAKALETPEGKLLAEYLLLLERSLPDLDPGDGPRLSHAIETMVAACLAPTGDRVAKARPQIDLALMEKVRQVVRKHLRSPSLGPGKLCHEAATSRSQLYRLLEGQGGVAHYIQRCRLSESLVLLSDVSNILPIARIAEILCFADASSFSRAFRREFGISPSDVRAASLAGLQPMPTAKKQTASGGIHSFGDFLRSF
jgi:AraC-like DNA-binding protein